MERTDTKRHKGMDSGQVGLQWPKLGVHVFLTPSMQVTPSGTVGEMSTRVIDGWIVANHGP